MATTISTVDIVGVDTTTLKVGDNGTATVQAGTVTTPNTNTATGTTVAGAADVAATTTQQVGVLDTTTTIGNAGTLSVSEVSTTTASATNVGSVIPAVSRVNEISTVTFPVTGTPTANAGDQFSITIDTTTYTTDALAGTEDRAAILAALAAKITAGSIATAAVNLAGDGLILTAKGTNPSPSFSPSGITQTTGTTAGFLPTASVATETTPGVAAAPAGMTAATATAEYSSNTGGILDTAGAAGVDITIGAGGVVGVTVDNTATATAVSTAGDATADALFTLGSYGLLDTKVTAGANGSVIANLDANAVATATTVGDPVTPTVANATAKAEFTVPTAGIYAATAGEGKIVVGDAGTVVGTAGVTADPLNISATATTTTGEAEADANANIVAGIGGDDTQITIGNAGTVTAAAVLVASSAATTVTADAAGTNAADASTQVTQVAGLGTTGVGDVKVGSDATITAVGSSTSSATAASTDGKDLATNATVDNDKVSGIYLATLTAGNNASVTASAASTQTATASTVGAITGADDQAVATVAAADTITGIDTTTVAINNDASKLSVSASLIGTATSSNVNGAGSGLGSQSAAGLGSEVIGIDTGSVTVGNSLTGANGLRVDAISNLTATATGVAGAADADAGDNAALVTAINAATTKVGNSGNITAVAASTLNATASTTAGAAKADAYQTGDGILNSAITVGNDGNLIGQTTLVGNAAATTVGSSTTAAAAEANLTLDGNGISQATEAIKVGDTGNVTGNSFNSGGAIAQTTYGGATANGQVTAEGIDLVADTSDITVGGAGNVTGLAVLGTLNSSGNLANQIQVTASSVSATADADGTFNAAGIFGVDAAEATITAGPRDGDISGQVFAGGNVVASTTGDAIGDTADAKINTSDLYGIKDVNLVGGQAGTNLVRGTAVGDFDATATSVAGPATGDSTVSAYGIFNSDPTTANTLNVNGGVSAIAQLSNTVTATSVAGDAKATATSNVTGLSGYNVTIIAGGTLTASAISNASSTATSVAGGV